MTYRVIHKYGRFYPQSRFLWIWWNFDFYGTIYYHNEAEAMDFIKKYISDNNIIVKI